MKVEEVPQDRNRSYEGGCKVCYAVDRDGRIVKTPTSGWKVEEDATNIAWQAIRADLERIQGEVLSGRQSPLAFFMAFRQMTIPLLARHLGICSWRVRRHLHPRAFARLDDRQLARYAEWLDVPVQTLKDPASIEKILKEAFPS